MEKSEGWECIAGKVLKDGNVLKDGKVLMDGKVLKDGKVLNNGNGQGIVNLQIC